MIEVLKQPQNSVLIKLSYILKIIVHFNSDQKNL